MPITVFTIYIAELVLFFELLLLWYIKAHLIAYNFPEPPAIHVHIHTLHFCAYHFFSLRSRLTIPYNCPVFFLSIFLYFFLFSFFHTTHFNPFYSKSFIHAVPLYNFDGFQLDVFIMKSNTKYNSQYIMYSEKKKCRLVLSCVVCRYTCLLE